MIHCKIHPRQPLTILFTSTVCDLCSPPKVHDIPVWFAEQPCRKSEFDFKKHFGDSIAKRSFRVTVPDECVHYEMVWSAKDSDGNYSIYHSDKPITVTPPVKDPWADQELVSDLYR